MADSIFEEDELQADALTEDEAPDEEQVEERPRDEHGRFIKADDDEPGSVSEDASAEEEKPHDKTVPQGALHAERERRKSVEAELKAAREQLEAIANMRKQVAERKPEALPAADDPAAVEHLRNRLAELDQRQTQVTQRMDTADLNQRETQELGTLMQSSEAQFRVETPDYDDGIAHLVAARAAELAEYNVPAAQAQQIIAEEAVEIVRTAVQLGRNPAELAYAIAKSRGYRPTQAEQQQNGGAQPNGGAAATVEAIAKAQAASKSLGNGGGSSAHQLNAEAIGAMDDDEFERLYATPEGRALINSL
jgi:hypothetical protein